MRMVTNTSLVHPLLPKLKQLRLSGMLSTLEVRADQAAREQLAPGEFLALLLDDEIERRDQGRVRLRLQEAGWEEGKTLARFDFSALPGLNRTLVAEWAYVRAYTTNAERTAALASWLHLYNHHRAHTALGGHPPISLVGVLAVSGPGHTTPPEGPP